MNQTRLDVLGFGAAIVDALARVEEDALVAEGLAKGTMALIDQARADTIEERFGPTQLISGGSAANTCAGVASLGGAAGFVGKVRDDVFGEHFARDMRATGVAYDVAPATAGLGTARCYVLVTPDGERTMNTFLGAAQGLQPDDLDGALAENAQVLFAEGYIWDAPGAAATFRKAAEIAKRGEGRVAFTLSDPFCVDRHRAEFLDLIRSGTVDLVFANESEAKSLYETAELDAALDGLANDADLAVVTRGEHGAIVVSRSGRREVHAAPVERVVDATGAGDLFAAAYSAERLWDPDYNMTLGSYHLGELMSQFRGSMLMTTVGYNAGPARPPQWVARCGDPRGGVAGGGVDPVDFIECAPFTETRNYMMRVMENMAVYKARLNGGSAPLTTSADIARGAGGPQPYQP